MHRTINLSNSMILVADGDPFFSNLLRSVLRSFGANGIVLEDDGKESLELVKGGGVDLVICDAMLKSIRGFDLCKAIRGLENPDLRFLPIILMTSHTQFGNVVSARDCGVSTVLAKPLVPQFLFDRLIGLTHDKRRMVVTPDFVGPDRRFHDTAPPDGNHKRHDDE